MIEYEEDGVWVEVDLFTGYRLNTVTGKLHRIRRIPPLDAPVMETASDGLPLVYFDRDGAYTLGMKDAFCLVKDWETVFGKAGTATELEDSGQDSGHFGVDDEYE